MCCGNNNCPLRFVGGECFHCKVCFQCCNQKLTRCTLCGTRTCDDCLDYMKTALLNNEDGHRCPTCEDQAESPGWRMRMVIDRMRRTGEVPMTESELEQWLKDGPRAIDGKWVVCDLGSVCKCLFLFLMRPKHHLTKQSVFDSNITVVILFATTCCFVPQLCSVTYVLIFRTVFCYQWHPLQIHVEGRKHSECMFLGVAAIWCMMLPLIFVIRVCYGACVIWHLRFVLVDTSLQGVSCTEWEEGSNDYSRSAIEEMLRHPLVIRVMCNSPNLHAPRRSSGNLACRVVHVEFIFMFLVMILVRWTAQRSAQWFLHAMWKTHQATAIRDHWCCSCVLPPCHLSVAPP